MNIALIGYGKMGREIERAAVARGITVGPVFDDTNNADGKGLTRAALKGVDVCIDFSTPGACLANIRAAANAGVNIVVGTTGWYDKLPQAKKIVRAKKTGLLYAPNFSLGMNVFTRLAAAAAEYFDNFPMYDAAVSEVHHTGKADSPSGTALLLGQAILDHMKRKKVMLTAPARGPIKPGQLHVTSTRLGSVVGTHEIVFDSDADSVTLVHAAKNRSGFALGALVAAEWLNGRRGCYTMNDVLESL
jgi:4-hydroxy-tetrahydrodipicolinate reductase